VARILDLQIQVELGAAEYVTPQWTPGLLVPLESVIDINEICDKYPRVVRESYPSKSFIKTLSNPESGDEVNRRMLSTLFHKSVQHEGECILIVSHGQMFWETRTTWLKKGRDSWILPYAAISGFLRIETEWYEIEDVHGKHWENDPEYLEYKHI
jgi:broad specificity phosphatase PhoE